MLLIGSTSASYMFNFIGGSPLEGLLYLILNNVISAGTPKMSSEDSIKTFDWLWFVEVTLYFSWFFLFRLL